VGVNAGEKLHQLAGAKLHHGGFADHGVRFAARIGGCARSRRAVKPRSAQARAEGAGLGVPGMGTGLEVKVLCGASW
jgi:hypothetical protein